MLLVHMNGDRNMFLPSGPGGHEAEATARTHDSPTRSVGENNITFFSRPLCERHTSVFLPVTHGLTENGSLAAWKE